MNTETVYLLLGTNLGEREVYLRQARQLIGQTVGKILTQSLVYETAAWGVADQPAFFNQVLAVETRLSPAELLAQTQRIEQSAGRVRHEKWQARTLDIDILFYGQQVIELPELRIPHPEVQHRRFTLVPLAEIAPGLWHPVLNTAIARLLEICADPLEVTILKA